MEITALYSEYSEYTFAKRLGILIGIDMAIALGDTYVPQSWTVARDSIALVQLGVMAATMAVAIRRVLEDY